MGADVEERLRKMCDEAIASIDELTEQELKTMVGTIEYPIMQFFAYSHLSPHLQEVSKPVGELAELMAGTLPINDETIEGLRKLLEAKDCFVRAKLMR